MRHALKVVCLASIGLATIPSPTFACSMVPGYEVPTNLELAAAADTIVIATVSGEKAGAEEWDGSIITIPELLLKGSALPSTVEVSGSHLGKAKRRATKSNPRELRAANPDALMGGCVRYIFSKGMKLVLFLKRNEDGNLVPYRSAFSRDSEDVPDHDALWVKAVREYAAISVFPKEEWKTRLLARAAELRLETGDADAIAIAKDLEVEASGKRLLPYD